MPSAQHRPARGRGFPALIALSLSLMGVAWVVGNPPGTVPDEEDHYVKALGAGGGELYGRPVSERRPTRGEVRRFLKARPGQPASPPAGEVEAARRSALWLRSTRREFSVPEGLVYGGFQCARWSPQASASCLERDHVVAGATEASSHMGTYQPYLYALAGVAMRPAGDPLTAMRLGRMVFAAISLGLIALSAVMLWEGSRGALSLAGLVLAVAPGVIYFSSSLNPSGPELAAAICFVGALLRLVRADGQSGFAWSVAGVSGAVLALARSLGPLFAVSLAVGVGMLIGRRAAVRLVRTNLRRAAPAAAAILAASVAGLLWEVRYQAHLRIHLDEFPSEAGSSVARLPSLAREAVGTFGPLDTQLPWPVPLLWGTMLATLLVLAFKVAGRREQVALLAGLAGSIAATSVFGGVYRQTGFDLQARHLLPLWVLVPLVAGEVLSLHHRRLRPRFAAALLVFIFAAAAAGHLIGWYVNGRRFAVGSDGPWNFIPHAEWTPPGGWTLWLIAMSTGAAAYALAGRAAARGLGDPQQNGPAALAERPRTS